VQCLRLRMGNARQPESGARVDRVKPRANPPGLLTQTTTQLSAPNYRTVMARMGRGLGDDRSLREVWSPNDGNNLTTPVYPSVLIQLGCGVQDRRCMAPQPNRPAAHDVVLMVVYCALTMLGIVTAFFL
jgi:hypothetical protein